MHFLCRTFIGTSSNSNWSQYWENEPDNPALALSHGHLFGLINLSTPTPDTDLITFGRDLISIFNQAYYNSTSPSIVSRLQSAVDTILAKVDATTAISLGVCLVHQHRATFLTYGSIEINLKRQQQIAKILIGSLDQVNFIQGPLQHLDLISISTTDFITSLGFDQLKEIYSLSTLQTIEETILSKFYSLPDQSGLSSCLIQVNSPTESLPPPVSQPVTSVFKPKPVTVASPANLLVRRKKVNLAVIVLLIGLLTISSILGYRQNQLKKTNQLYSQQLSALNQKIASASEVKAVSLDAAQALVEQINQDYQSLKKIKPTSPDYQSIEDQIKNLSLTTGAKDAYQPQEIYQAKLLKANPDYRQISLEGNNAYFLSTTLNRIDQIDVNTKKQTEIYSGPIGDIIDLAVTNGKVYLLYADHLSLVSASKLESVLDLKLPDSAIPKSIEFWNGALYLLDVGTPTIWKYTPTATGFQPAVNWVKSEKITTSPQSFAINGNVWVLSTNGQVQEFTRGVPQTFAYQADNKFDSPRLLSTHPDSKFISFVDKDNYLYLVNKTDKTITRRQLAHQILSQKMSASAVYVFLANQTLYQITL
ncbi:MAG TPA: hypothetical protein PK639_00060 [Candidatus Woesebacteria bacterium]|nr:hypothetical protein [Candidatus Woesebacteria bacterium]